MMKRLTLTLALAVFTAAPAVSQTLSLDEAIAIGLAHNRTIANAAMQVEKAEQEIADARSKRLPSFSIEAQASRLLRPIDLRFPRGTFGTFEGIGPVPAEDALLTTPTNVSVILDAQISQPLTQLKKLNLHVRLNEAAREWEREQLRDARLGLVDEIRRLYYAIAQTRSAVEATDASIALLQELHRVVSRRVTQQVALKGDSINVQSRMAQAELTRLSLRHQIATQKEQLNQMLGRDLRTAFDVADLPDARLVEVDLAIAQNRAMDARPDVQQARVRFEQSRIARRIAKADYLPDVGIALSYLSPMNINGAPRNIASVALQAKWEPFDWGRKGRALASKDLAIRQAGNSVRETEERALLDINRRFRRLEEARAQVRAARLEQDAAGEQARVKVTQYDLQASLLTDVLQAQSAVADTNHQFQQALAGFWTARADFERALGAIEEGIER